MSQDADIPGCVPRNASVPEELSRVEFIFTDKTGTLTKNEMTLKKLYVYGGHEIDVEEDRKTINHVKNAISKNLIAFPPVEVDLENLSVGSLTEKLNITAQNTSFTNVNTSIINNKKRSKSAKYQSLKNAITMLATCNNVTPTTETAVKDFNSTPNSDNNARILQASSPDEIAFVEFTDNIGY